MTVEDDNPKPTATRATLCQHSDSSRFRLFERHPEASHGDCVQCEVVLLEHKSLLECHTLLLQKLQIIQEMLANESLLPSSTLAIAPVSRKFRDEGTGGLSIQM